MRLTELWFTERMNPNEEARDERRAKRRAAHDAPSTRRPVSLAPGFSRVRWRGKMVQPLQRFPTSGKPLKRFASFERRDTRLKPGANEIPTPAAFD